MAEESEIDLYDNVDDIWKRESLDLYDDVESHSNSDTQKESKPTSQSNYSGRRIATYVGNLRWWTTDQDILDALSKLDLKDILEVRFHENRQNGQSKGFCVVVFGSDKSTKEAMEKLPKSEIHGLAPIVTFCNKQNLNYFEQAAGGGTTCGTSGSSTNNLNNNSTNNNGNKMKTEMCRNNGPSSITGNINGITTNMNNNQMQIGSMGNNNNNNNMRFAANMVAMPSMAAGLSQNLLFNLSQQYAQNSMNRLPNMMMPNTINGPLNVGAGHMNMSMNTQRFMQPGMMMPQNSIQMSGNIGTVSGNTPHLNPNFFNTVTAVQASGMMGNMTMNSRQLGTTNHQPQFDTFGRPITNSFSTTLSSSATSFGNSMTDLSSSKLSEHEFDEILQRNKTVSSSAINRSVQDASSGDYASAIETLVTAISLIKQSRIAGDNRCKVLINSLQDTLTGIESKSYGSRRSRTQQQQQPRRRQRQSYSDSSDEDNSRRVLRSRSRDRRRRSREYGTNQNSTNHTSTTATNNASGSSDYFSDRYGSTRYRH